MEIIISIVVAVAISSLTIVFEDVIKNLAAGIFIWREKRFVNGNMIGIDGVGDFQITKIGWRSTLAVDTNSGLYTMLNNSDLIGQTIRNYSRSEWYYTSVHIPLDGDEDIEAIEELLFETTEDLDWIVFGVESRVELAAVEDDHIVFEVDVPVQPTKSPAMWQSRLRKALLMALNEEGIEVAVPDLVRVNLQEKN
ncbi:mechanosensitive ion channel [Chloroflexi bacterium TSY]|nr:mechanosensitive ion channel [Chloroflexi bacterium TSY]